MPSCSLMTWWSNLDCQLPMAFSFTYFLVRLLSINWLISNRILYCLLMTMTMTLYPYCLRSRGWSSMSCQPGCRIKYTSSGSLESLSQWWRDMRAFLVLTWQNIMIIISNRKKWVWTIPIKLKAKRMIDWGTVSTTTPGTSVRNTCNSSSNKIHNLYLLLIISWPKPNKNTTWKIELPFWPKIIRRRRISCSWKSKKWGRLCWINWSIYHSRSFKSLTFRKCCTNTGIISFRLFICKCCWTGCKINMIDLRLKKYLLK